MPPSPYTCLGCRQPERTYNRGRLCNSCLRLKDMIEAGAISERYHGDAVVSRLVRMLRHRRERTRTCAVPMQHKVPDFVGYDLPRIAVLGHSLSSQMGDS